MRELPVGKIPGIGMVTESILERALDITKCGQFLEKKDLIYQLYTPTNVDLFFRFFFPNTFANN